MDSKVKLEWLKALRSGDYIQGAGTLYDGKKYCVLGVLCDLHAKETSNNWIQTVPGRYYYYGWASGLPPVVRKWAGLDHIFPKVQTDKEKSGLSKLNDTGYTFLQIANLIKEQY